MRLEDFGRVRGGVGVESGSSTATPTAAAEAAQPHLSRMPAMVSPGPRALFQRILEGTLGHPIIPIAEEAPPLRRWPRGCHSSCFTCSLTFSSITAFALAFALAFTFPGPGIVQLWI